MKKITALLGFLGLILALGAFLAPSASARPEYGNPKLLDTHAEFNNAVVHGHVYYKVGRNPGDRWVRATDMSFLVQNDHDPVCGPTDIYDGYKGVFWFQAYDGSNFRVKFDVNCDRDGRTLEMKSLRNKPRLPIGPPLYPGGPRQGPRMHGEITKKLDFGQPDTTKRVSGVFSSRLR